MWFGYILYDFVKGFWAILIPLGNDIFLSFLEMGSHTMVNLEINLLMYWILHTNPLNCFSYLGGGMVMMAVILERSFINTSRTDDIT